MFGTAESRMKLRILTVIFALLSVAGCARWLPERKSPIKLTAACPLKRAPALTDYGSKGARGIYHFVVQDAQKANLVAFLSKAEAAGFHVILMTMNINGRDTLFAAGPARLSTQAQVDKEFNIACGLGRGKVFLTHVRYDSGDSTAETVRVR
jgi:hypothetical protein